MNSEGADMIEEVTATMVKEVAGRDGIESNGTSGLFSVRLQSHPRLASSVKRMINDMFRVMMISEQDFDFQRCYNDVMAALSETYVHPTSLLARDSKGKGPAGQASELSEVSASSGGDNSNGHSTANTSNSGTASLGGSHHGEGNGGVPNNSTYSGVDVGFFIHDAGPMGAVPPRLERLIKRYGLNLDIKPKRIPEGDVWLKGLNKEGLQDLVMDMASNGPEDPEDQNRIRLDVEQVFNSPEVLNWFKLSFLVECDKNMGVAAISRGKWTAMVRRFMNKSMSFKKIDLTMEFQTVVKTLTENIWTMNPKYAQGGKGIPQTVEDLLGNMPLFRCTLKVHKEPHGIRPIVSYYDTYLTKTAQEVDIGITILSKCLMKMHDDHQMILDAKEAQGLLKSNPKTLATLDFESLYTNINNEHMMKTLADYCYKEMKVFRIDKKTATPLTEFGEIIHKTQIAVKDILGKLRGHLKIGYFVYQDELYLQQNGIPMGSQFSPKLANLYLQILEWKFTKRTGTRLELVRYIDDILTTKEYPWKQVYDMDNSGLTLVLQQSGTDVAFLDMQILKRHPSGPWETKWYFEERQTV